jgi:uncharacterized protein
MQLSSQQTLPVAQDIAWAALNDTSLLQAAIPGCESITPTGENMFDVALMAAVGPVKARFKGKLKLMDLQPPNAYKLQFEGQGGAAGHGKGSAEVTLESTGPHSTLLHYTAQATVGGKIAQIGSRLVDMAAQKMAGEFFDNFTQALVERHGVPAPAAEAAPAGWFTRLRLWLRRLLG